MRGWKNNRWLSIAVAVGYALTITTASLFHNHSSHGGGCCDQGPSLVHAASSRCHHGELDGDAVHGNVPKTPTHGPSDGKHCSVCQYLAHKPAPTAGVTAADAGLLVQEVSSLRLARVAVDSFSAWQSRAPPAFA
jgi:hypothetical protein